MRLQKLKENKRVKCDSFHDFINCGECYLLTEWINEKHVPITLNKDTILEDLHEKHGGSIHYSKFCSKTFHLYESMNRSLHDDDLDEVLSWTMIDPYEGYYDIQLLKALITGGQPKELRTVPCIVRWANKGSRGIDWYLVFNG